MPTATQLANLRPARPGEVRNPEGRNQWTAERERRERFRAVCRALNRCEDADLEQPLKAALARQVVDGAIAGDSRLLSQLLDYLMPPPDGSRRRYNRRRRLATASRSEDD